MALWGKKDTVYSTGHISGISISNDDAVIIGNGTTWTELNGVVPGLVITISGKGAGVIRTVDSPSQLTLVGDTGFTAETGLTSLYNISEQPKYLTHDTNWGTDEIYGIDNAETAAANATSYEVSHAGWVGVTTYMDNSHNPPIMRVKKEVLVAMGADDQGDGGISNDNNADDTVFTP